MQVQRFLAKATPLFLRRTLRLLFLPRDINQIRGTLNYIRFRKRDDSILVSGLRNIHAGKKIFICGAGPSLNATPLKKLEAHPIIFVNSSFAIMNQGFRPVSAYWMIGSEKAMNVFRSVDRDLFDLSFRCIGAQFIKLEPGAVSDRDVILRRPVIKGLFRIVDDSSKNFSFDVSKEICHGGGGSIVFSAIQLAHFMGASEIVLVGLDMGVREGEPSHFDLDRKEERHIHDERFERTSAAFANYLNILSERGVRLLNGSSWTKDKTLPKIRL